MAKYRRQPKAGELAYKTSARFAERPRDVPLRPLIPARPETSRENTDISQWRHKITFCDARRAYGSDTWRIKGGMSGGKNGSCAGVTSNNGMNVIPQAFNK